MLLQFSIWRRENSMNWHTMVSITSKGRGNIANGLCFIRFLRLLVRDSACPKCFLVVKIILAFQAEILETFCRKKKNSCLVIFQGRCVCPKYSGGSLQLPPGNNYCNSCLEPCTSVTGGAGVSAIWTILRENRKSWKSWLKAQHSENEDHGIWSHHFMANRWGNSGNSVRLYFLGLQNHCRWWLQPWN